MDELTLLREGEREDDLQLFGLRLLQKRAGFRFGMDAVLLADFADFRPRDVVADFGSGTGVLPLLLHGRGKGARWECFELQPEMADMARRTMQLNHLEDCVQVHCLPVERAEEVLPPLSLDGIICNPPYGAPGKTMQSASAAVRIARHQGEDGLAAWWRTAYRLLKGKGRLAMVYPAPELFSAMNALQRAGLTPKRFRLVYHDGKRPARLALIEAMKDARPGLQPMPPLIVYHEDGSLTEELRRIYHMDEQEG